MSKDILGIEDKTFAESPGLPANAHAKKLSKAKAKAEKEKAIFQKTVYTVNGNKVVQITIYPKGAKSVYMGNKKKDEEHFKKQIADWKKEGVWIGQDDFEDKCEEIRKQLYDASLK